MISLEILPLLLMILFFIVYIFIYLLKITKKYNQKRARKEKYKNESPAKQFETTILLLIKHFFINNSMFKNIYIKTQNGSLTEIDILAVHNTGIYILECKNYFGSVEGSVNDTKWYQTNKDGIKCEVPNPIKQNKYHLKAVKSLLNNFDLPYYSIVIFSNKCKMPNISYKADNTYIIYQKELVSLIQYLTSQRHIYTNKVIYKIIEIINQKSRLNPKDYKH